MNQIAPAMTSKGNPKAIFYIHLDNQRLSHQNDVLRHVQRENSFIYGHNESVTAKQQGIPRVIEKIY